MRTVRILTATPGARLGGQQRRGGGAGGPRLSGQTSQPHSRRAEGHRIENY